MSSVFVDFSISPTEVAAKLSSITIFPSFNLDHFSPLISAGLERATAYDDYLERVIRRVNEDEIIAMAKRHTDIAVAMQTKALNGLTKLDPNDLKAGDITTMMKTAIDIERTTRGEATEITKQEQNISGNIEVGIYLPNNQRGW